MKNASSWNPTVTPPNDANAEEHQKWDHITLSDFRSSSCWTSLSYCYLWLLATIAVAVYAADTYTAVVLLAYNRWPGEIQPAIPFKASRWLFAACIIFSWLLCAYQWFRAFRVIRRKSVVRDYLDPLAAILQSMRSWRRFLVFAELTKSRKGTDYVVLFTYFQFKGALRILVAEGPRQAINGITLYAVTRSNLISNDSSKDASLAQFWTNVRVLASQQHAHAIILFTMLFTLFIWIISALSLLAACLAWLFFLWHYAERGDLSGWCKHKIEKRLRNIVEKTFAKELVRQEGLRRAGRTHGSASTIFLDMRRPTLPNVCNDEKGLSISQFSALGQLPYNSILLSRQPPRKSSVPLAKRPTLPVIDESPIIKDSAFGLPSRESSNASTSTGSSAPLQQSHRPPQPLPVSSTGIASTPLNGPFSHQRLSASKSSIVPPPLSIRRKPLPVHENSSQRDVSQAAVVHHEVHNQTSNSHQTLSSAAIRATTNVSEEDRFSFQEHLPHLQGVRIYDAPVEQRQYDPTNGTKRQPAAHMSQRGGNSQRPARAGPSTFAAMGL